MRNKSLQSQVTTGRLTLPVVILICTLCWVSTYFLFPDLITSATQESLSSFWQSARDLLFPGWAERIVSFLCLRRYRLFPDRAEQPVRHHPHEGFHADSHLLPAGHRLSGDAPVICRRHCCPGFPHFHLFPIQKLSAVAFIRSSVLFLFLYRSGKHSFPTAHHPLGALVARILPFPVAHSA